MSLKNLKRDKIETLLIHNPSDLQKPGNIFLKDWLKRIKYSNLVENIGLSIYSNNDLKNVENSEILPFDADNDGDLDLYFSSGSVEHSIYSQTLYDRLLINNGKGEFIDSNQEQIQVPPSKQWIHILPLNGEITISDN